MKQLETKLRYFKLRTLRFEPATCYKPLIAASLDILWFRANLLFIEAKPWLEIQKFKLWIRIETSKLWIQMETCQELLYQSVNKFHQTNKLNKHWRWSTLSPVAGLTVSLDNCIQSIEFLFEKIEEFQKKSSKFLKKMKTNIGDRFSGDERR